MPSTTRGEAAPRLETGVAVESAQAASRFSWERLLFALAVTIGAGSFLLSPRPPMVDFAAHAGQVALWRDLILGVSPFASEVWINLLTPYLIGYGLALPFSFVMPQSMAMQLILALAFVAYIGAARGLRREVGGDERLDWLFLFGFFGLAWTWGLYTFLVAAPLTLLMIRQSIRVDAAPTATRSAILLFLGALLLFSHGLQLVFVCIVGAALILERFVRESRQQGWTTAFLGAAKRALPYAALTAMFVLLLHLRRNVADPPVSSLFNFGPPVWFRPLYALIKVWSWNTDSRFLIVTMVAAAAPVLMGFRIASGPSRTMLAALVLFLLFGVSSAAGTGLLNDRFALYLLPFWALAWRAGPQTRRRHAAGALLVLAAFAALGLHVWRIEAFRREDRGFDAILAATRPGERALSLVYDRASAGSGMDQQYLHWGQWLQSERGAFVDFNFAYFPPQVVRFRRDKFPAVLEQQSWTPEQFDWNAWNGGLYDLFLTRGTEEEKRRHLLSRAPCPLEVAAQAGLWTLYRKGACQPPAGAG